MTVRSFLAKAFSRDRQSDGKLSDVTSNVTAMQQMQQLGGPGTRVVVMNGNDAFEWFGPGRPLVPIAPPNVAGRQLDYPVYQNLQTKPRAYEPISYEILRAASDPSLGGLDLLRLAIETRKDQIEAFEWSIIARDGETVSKDELKKATEFFHRPDREHFWSQWLRMLLEDLLVLDAMAVYPRGTRGGQLYSLDLIASDTIKRVIDYYGRTPLPPDPAYQQVLKGLPAVDYVAYQPGFKGGEMEPLIYTHRNPRTNRIYGYSPTEQVLSTVNIALRRQTSQLQYYTEGNIPEAICGVPEGWSAKDVAAFQTWWDSIMQGDTAARRRVTFIPIGNASGFKELKLNPLKDEYDDWLARIICFCFSIPPTALIRQVNRATAQTSADEAKEEGLIPLLNFLAAFFDSLLAGPYGDPRLKFRWKLNKEIKPLDQAQVDELYIGMGVYDQNLPRERMGLTKLSPDELKALKPVAAPPPISPPGSPPGVKAPTPKAAKEKQSAEMEGAE